MKMSKRKQKGNGVFDMVYDKITDPDGSDKKKRDQMISNGIMGAVNGIKSGMGKRTQKGGNFFGDAVDWTKTAASDTNDFLRNTKVISKGANLVGTVASAIPLPQAQGVATGAKAVEMGANAVGWGRKKKKKNTKKLKKVVVYIYK